MMKRVNVYSLRLVKEKGHNFDVDGLYNSSELCAGLINALFDLENRPSEMFGILCFTTKLTIAGAHIINMGTINQVGVFPSDVFKAALLNNAKHILLFHNHPSGDTQYSNDDIQITKRIKEIGRMLDIEVLDHIIIGRNKFLSLKSKGLC